MSLPFITPEQAFDLSQEAIQTAKNLQQINTDFRSNYLLRPGTKLKQHSKALQKNPSHQLDLFSSLGAEDSPDFVNKFVNP